MATNITDKQNKLEALLNPAFDFITETYEALVKELFSAAPEVNGVYHDLDGVLTISTEEGETNIVDLKEDERFNQLFNWDEAVISHLSFEHGVRSEEYWRD